MISSGRLNRINFYRILQQIWANRGISRISIAQQLNLNRSTVTKVVNRLLEYGLVVTTGKYHGKPGVGRMATALEINSNFGLVLGIEVQTDFFRSLLVNLEGKPLESETKAFRKGTDILEDELVNLINAAKLRAESEGIPLLGAGIGLSGIVDPYAGTILHSNSLKIDKPVHLKEGLCQRTGLPIFIENDANCCCWSEIAFRANKHNNFLAVLGEFRMVDAIENRKKGVALGLGIVIQGKVLHGDNYTTGEFLSLFYDNKKPSHNQFSITDEEALSLPDNREVLLRVFNELARNVSLLVNCLDITKIIVTGDFSRYSEDFEPLLKLEIQRNWIYPTVKNCVIEFPSDESQAVSFGAAGLFVCKLFSVPDMTDQTDEEIGCILLKKLNPR
ncbi:MAG: ROK family transcriptional regulator [Spirochaetales bacterium]|nr:ROK family transcriptional regulator [Spirochaetales bacterium]